MPEVQEDEVPVIFVELYEKGESGFIKQGTEGTPFEERLQFPSRRYIPTEGMRKGVKKSTALINGESKEVETRYNEKIRWIANETEISVARQKELGIDWENGGRYNKIAIDKGYLTVAREGSGVGLYDYLTQVFYNVDAPGRSQNATKIFRIIQKDKEAEVYNESEMIAVDAVKYVGTLVTKVAEGQYKYNQEKLDGLCQIMNIWAETNATKIKALFVNAKDHPKDFMELVTIWENTTVTEVTQALKLKVLAFDKNMVMYPAKDKVAKSLGTENLKYDEKIARYADWLRTSDGHEAYLELKAELEAAQDKQLKQ